MIKTVINALSKAERLARYRAQGSTNVVTTLTNSVDDIFKQAQQLQRKTKYKAQNVSSQSNLDDDFMHWLHPNRHTNSKGMSQNYQEITTQASTVQKGKASSNKSKYANPDIDKIKIPLENIQNTNVVIPDWGNTGWKLHLPVQPNANDSLTNDICNFLNKKWGLDITKRTTRGGHPTNAPSFFQQGSDGLSRYKVGQCSDTLTGKGMTIYGTAGTQEEIFELAKEIEMLFGKRIANSGCPIYAKEMHVTPHVSARFVDKAEILLRPKRYDYCEHINKDVQGLITGKNYGTCVSSLDNLDTSHWPKHVLGNKQLENEFLAGDSVVETIRDYGEMFTGKIVNGKMPSFILECFSPEYLRYHPTLIKELPDIIAQGNLRYVKSMLNSIATERINLISGRHIPPLDGQKGKIEYLTQIDKKLIEQAKKELSQENPNFLYKLKANIQAESSVYPELIKLL